MIQFLDVSKVFKDSEGREITAVDGLNLTVESGETLCLIGTSGCGKTTAIKLVNRLIEPTRGRILLGEDDVQTLDPIRLRRRIGYVIQNGGLFPHMTVGGNIGLLCDIEGWSGAATRSRVQELLDLVNLPAREFFHRYPRDLSGGQRQRVGVARALALDPPYVLMDEPFGALDPISRDQIQSEFLQLKQRVQKTIVIVTHDMVEAFMLADRIALMDGGKLLQAGTPDEFRHRPANAFVEEFLSRHLHAGTPHV